MRIVEDEQYIHNPLLREVFRSWHASRQGETPPPCDLASAEFAAEASYWHLLVAVHGDESFEVMTCGDGAGRFLGDAAFNQTDLPKALRRICTRTTQTRRALIDRKFAPAGATEPGHEVLTLPFLNRKGRIERLLGYITPRDDGNERPPDFRPAARSRKGIDR